MPQLFVASGATTWGRDAAKYPWTIGFQPSYAAEGLVYGQYIARTKKKAKVAVLFQNDDYGKDLLASLKAGLGRSGSKVVAAEAYQVTSSDVGSQVAKLKASGANVFCIFATPTFAIQSYVFANRLGWKPLVINNAVSGTSNIMVLASEGGKNKLVEGTITTTVLKDPTDPRWNKDAGMKQYRALLAKYAKGANPNDVYHVYGMAVGYETVSLLRRLGANPDPRRPHDARPLDREPEEPVPAARRRREDGQGRQLPDPAGAAAALDEGALRACRRALDVQAELAVDGLRYMSTIVEHLDRGARALRDTRRQLERLVATLALDDVEAADRLLRLGERAVDDEGLLARSHDDGVVARTPRRARARRVRAASTRTRCARRRSRVARPRQRGLRLRGRRGSETGIASLLLGSFG